MTQISIIVAVSENNVIGLNNSLPWQLSADLKHFKALTTGFPVLMGRRTFESLPNGPLPNRLNIVLSGQKVSEQPENYKIVNSIEQALDLCNHAERMYIIGGSTVYNQFLDVAQILYLTRVHAKINGDAFFPEIDLHVWELLEEEKHVADEKNQFDYSFLIYRKRK